VVLREPPGDPSGVGTSRTPPPNPHTGLMVGRMAESAIPRHGTRLESRGVDYNLPKSMKLISKE
jgi:hypothetical protein